MHAGPPRQLSNEVSKLLQQDRAVPGSLADAVQYAVTMGLLQPSLSMPVLEVAGNADDRAVLGGTPGSRDMLPAGCATATAGTCHMCNR